MIFFKSNNAITGIIKGVIIAFLFTIFALIIFSILLVYTNISEQTIAPVIITVTGISILMGSSIATRKLKNNGLLNGATIGFIYMMILYLISSTANSDFSITFLTIIILLAGIIGGIIGGVIGVNT